MKEINNKDEKDLMEAKMVDDAFQKLIDTYLASKHRKKVEKITKAFNFARHAHKGVRRLSGEPYIMHPLAVAQIVSGEIGLGSTSICAALLHDVVEDTDYTVEDIKNMFGEKIAQIVDGLTKISGGIFGDHASAQAENFRKLLLTMSDDIRVIIIKMADRLHNMRTLGSQPVNKRYKIAGETLYIYAPLANRLGLNAIKTELEDLSFKYEHPGEYDAIERKLAATEEKRNSIFEAFTAPIREQLDKMNFNYEIKARVKSPYSIWQKMQNKHVPFEDIFDILAVRIIFQPKKQEEELNECFDIYVSISKIYKSHPDRLRDWVSHPKANGYQALHVTLMSPTGQWVEVQIRSQRMDEIAERGFAAHWKYKEGEHADKDSENELDKWLTTIQEILDDPQPNAIDFLDTIKLNLFASEIFVFTPKGELRTMPQDSTVLDFAFTVHTQVGSHCLGAKVNHKLVPMSYKLASGDQVEVITSKSAHVDKSWLNIVTSAKAKSKISAIIRKEEREARKKGEETIGAFFEKEDIEYSDSNLTKVAQLHDFKQNEAFLVALGQGKITLDNNDKTAVKGKETTSTWRNIFRFTKRNKEEDKKKAEKVNVGNIDRKKDILLSEDTVNVKYRLADCCKPIPGDSVMGYIDDGNSIVIHKLDCHVAARLKSSHGNRVLSARWTMNRILIFEAAVYIRGLDRMGLLNQITQVISQLLSVNIRKLEIETKEGLFEGKIYVFVHDTSDVRNIINNLKKIPDIKEVGRI